jgi:hypothetical protein
MRATILRAAIAALLIGLVAVTPLSAVISPGYFEILLPERDLLSGQSHTVELVDHTGLVRGMRLYSNEAAGAWNDGVTNPGRDPSELLVIRWSGGCGVNRTRLTLDRSSDGYVLHEQTAGVGCVFLVLKGWQVGVVLWRPLDASTVSFVSLD